MYKKGVIGLAGLGDRHCLGDALGSFGQYIMISSGAVYPEDAEKPFREESPRVVNRFWGKYGADKMEAETELLKRVPDAYLLRPPYLYGPMNNVYREAFVFDCAKADRKFYLPGDGGQRLQFFHVRDLCGVMEAIMETNPAAHILNVGNKVTVSVKEWVTMCYACFGKEPSFVHVSKEIEQRNYFSFYDYDYELDVQKMQAVYPNTIPFEEGLKEAARWYRSNEAAVNKKAYFAYIDEKLT